MNYKGYRAQDVEFLSFAVNLRGACNKKKLSIKFLT